MLQNNLQKLKLSTMAVNLESALKQAYETKNDYYEFLFQLSSLEMKIKTENRLKRLIREAIFPIVRTLDTFDFNAS